MNETISRDPVRQRFSVSEAAQGLQPNILRPCPDAHVGRLHLLRFDCETAARRWLSLVVPHTASDDAARFWLQVAFTHAGLETLGLDALDLSELPQAFRDGMAKRAKILGDAPMAAPMGKVPHAALLVLTQPGEDLRKRLNAVGATARSAPGKLAEAARRVAEELENQLDALCGPDELKGITAGGNGVELIAAHDLHHPLVADEIVEYFGFRDGISQPEVQVDARLNRQIVLGPENLQPGSWLEGGTFLVIRQLAQNVAEFWKCLEEQRGAAPTAQDLAELLMGRKMNGSPLGPGAPAKSQNPTAPAFQPGDGLGTQPPTCPFQSHVRRMNPRLEPASSPDRQPRLLRRAMSYAEKESVGMMFMAYNASIERQFEFMQANWVQRGNHAGGLSGHRDPIASTAKPAAMEPPDGATFVTSRPGDDSVALSLPAFVSLRWGEYFFVPSRQALERLTGELEPALEWINDLRYARSFWDSRVPQLGLALGGYVFVKDPQAVRTILEDRHASRGFSVCEYGRKLRSLTGPFVLGMDVDTQDYKRENDIVQDLLKLVDTEKVACVAKQAAEEYLNSLAFTARLGQSQKAEVESKALIAVAISRVLGKVFGVPGPGSGSLLQWAQHITDAVFRVGQNDSKLANAEQTSKDLRGYVHDLIVEVRADPDLKKTPANSALAAVLGSAFSPKLSDDDTTRILTGVLVGSSTAVAGTFVPGLVCYARSVDGAVGKALRASNENQPTGSGDQWFLYRALAEALEREQMGGPDYLYRTYKGKKTFRPTADHVPVQPGDTVVVWIGGVPPKDTSDGEIRFGAGAHMCPGREMGRAIIHGVLEGLAGFPSLRAADERGLSFEFEVAS